MRNVPSAVAVSSINDCPENMPGFARVASQLSALSHGITALPCTEQSETTRIQLIYSPKTQTPMKAWSPTCYMARAFKLNTQFISFTASLEVAVYCAVKRFIEFGIQPRVATYSVGQYFEDIYDVSDRVPRESLAWRLASSFQECAIQDADVREVHFEKLLDLSRYRHIMTASFGTMVGSIAEFSASFAESEMKTSIQTIEESEVLVLTADVVGLPHYRHLYNGTDIIPQLLLENDNPRDRFAIAVRCRTLGIIVGHLSREHARVVRSMLEHSDNEYYNFENVDLRPRYETTIKLSFKVPKTEADGLIHRALDTCAECIRQQEIEV